MPHAGLGIHPASGEPPTPSSADRLISWRIALALLRASALVPHSPWSGPAPPIVHLTPQAASPVDVTRS